MEILFLIGNGFDINLDMPTSYKQFYESYKKVKNESKLITELKKDIKSEKNTWSDLELRLGEYMEKIESYEQFEEIYDDLLKELGDYLEEIENTIDWSLSDTQKLTKYLCSPEEFLPPRDFNKLKPFKDQFANSKWFVSIITYNFTRSIEKLLGENYKKLVIGFHHNSTEIILRDVQHIHGYIDEGMVVGINDASQLKNEVLRTNRKVLNTFIKSNNNEIQGHTIDEIFEQRIIRSQLICIFGSSIGDTDNIWWEKIGNRLLADDCYLVIFTKADEAINKRYIYKKGQWEDVIRERFLSKTMLNEKEVEKINSKIIVRSDTDMFKDLLIKTA